MKYFLLMIPKLSIVAQGGGMRGAYALGAVDALYSHFGLKRVDTVTGSSASVGTLTYFTSGQFYPAMNLWINELSNGRFLSFTNIFKKRPILDIDYLIDEVYKYKIPLDIDKLFSSKTELIVPLTNVQTGEVRYVSSKDRFSGFDPWNVLKASMAIPVAYGKTPIIGGETYFDSAYGNCIPFDIPTLEDSLKIIILTRNSPPKLDINELNPEKVPIPHFGLFHGKLREQMKKSELKFLHKLKIIEQLKSQGHIVIQPQIMLPRFDNSKRNLERCIEEGRKDVINNYGIQELIKRLKSSSKAKFYFEESI